MFEIHIGETHTLELKERRPGWSWRGRSVECAGGLPVAIILADRVFEQVHGEAAATGDEICGLLLGRATTWQGRFILEVEAAIAGNNTEAGPSHVTIDGESWTQMLREKDRHYVGLEILGWYHSHPRMDIFLSEMDLSIHRAFFAQPWHIALVINAQDQKVGLFSWHNEKIVAVEELTVLVSHGNRTRVELSPQGFPFFYVLRDAPKNQNHFASMKLLLSIIVSLIVLLLGKSLSS